MAEQEKTVDNYEGYVTPLFAPEDSVLRTVRDETEREGLPLINVSPSEGKLLHLLVLMSGARRILEIGTLGGYSAVWMARALPADGKLISLEIDQHHADVALANVKAAGLGNKVEIRVGPGLETLARLSALKEPAFDMIFIDADKDTYPAYLVKSLPLLREGGVLLADNTLPDAVLDEDATSGAKQYNADAAAHPDLVSIVIPVLRGTHLDGLTVSIKRTASAP